MGGLYWKRASKTGAYLALTAGMLSVLGLEPVQGLVGLVRLEKHLGCDITSAQIGLIATVAALVLMIVGSLVVPDHTPTQTTSEVTP